MRYHRPIQVFKDFRYLSSIKIMRFSSKNHKIAIFWANRPPIFQFLDTKCSVFRFLAYNRLWALFSWIYKDSRK